MTMHDMAPTTLFCILAAFGVAWMAGLGIGAYVGEHYAPCHHSHAAPNVHPHDPQEPSP